MKNIIALLIVLLCLLTSLSAFAVNVNTASAEEISEELKGIGIAKAGAIVRYREEKGPFKSLQDLINVKGIGAATVDKNRENIQLDLDE
ncbi:MAG: competence protein ComEA [Cycloclasticus sp.]|jgi:competence protein ComEA|tara:strand:+ start:1735 stop:2001 length:267 start_codon:yes stop_codon:yes gene_type:complete